MYQQMRLSQALSSQIKNWTRTFGVPNSLWSPKQTEKMKQQVYHEGYNYVLEYDNNSLIMYKEDTDEWMGDIEYIKVFTVEGDTPRPMTLYRKLVVAANKLIAQANSDWFMFNVTDQKRADLYERFTRSIKGYSCQRADKYFYLYRDQAT